MWETQVQGCASLAPALNMVFCSVSRKQGSEDSRLGPNPAPVGEEEVRL